MKPLAAGEPRIPEHPLCSQDTSLTQLTVYSYKYRATVMIQVTARSEAEADVHRCCLENEELEPKLTTLDGHRITAVSLEPGAGELDQVDGTPLEDLCSNEDCRSALDDGEGYDGECGNCADRRYSHDLGEHRHAPQHDCAACAEDS